MVKKSKIKILRELKKVTSQIRSAEKSLRNAKSSLKKATIGKTAFHIDTY